VDRRLGLTFAAISTVMFTIDVIAMDAICRWGA
jgi:hypothetical protein